MVMHTSLRLPYQIAPSAALACLAALVLVTGCGDQTAPPTEAAAAPAAQTDRTEPTQAAPPALDPDNEILAMWPPVRARPSTLEFGEVPQNQPIEKSVRLVNSGDTDVRLRHASTNCGCTTLDVAGMVVPANGSLELPVFFDAEGRTGDRHATVTLLFDGWERPITFNVRAVVIPS